MVGNGPASRSRTQVGNLKLIEKVSSPFYVTNFPVHLGVKELWDACAKVGTVVDVYIAKKLSKLEPDRKRQSDSHVHGDQVVSKINGQGLESYATVVKGGKGMHGLKEPKSTVCTLSGKEICNNLSLQASVFAKLRDIRLIQNLFVLLKEEGFDDLQIKYVASDWVYLTFLSEEVCARFKKCNGIKAYFSLFTPVVNGFFVKERAVWIEMIGLPCCAWNEDAISKVASMWGDVCFLDDDGDTPLAIKRACIKTSKPALIHETVKVVAQGIEYDLAFREISNWEPDILEEGEVGSDIPDLSDEEEPKDFFGEDMCDIQKDCQEGNGNEEVVDSLNVDNTPNLGDRGAGFVDRKCRFFQTSGRKKKVDRCFEDDERVNSIMCDASVKSPTRPERDSSPADEEIRQDGVVGVGLRNLYLILQGSSVRSYTGILILIPQRRDPLVHMVLLSC
ncbi:unnamed protein product [Lactuca virosa]|uniref:DUF4283 domain-containing protein n=1 Tax=Lactuca virosa TaxID=75947 RepID=A0AAU9LB59_9ASTR|nr:unnamed protein product [Lactuca virosa]